MIIGDVKYSTGYEISADRPFQARIAFAYEVGGVTDSAKYTLRCS